VVKVMRYVIPFRVVPDMTLGVTQQYREWRILCTTTAKYPESPGGLSLFVRDERGSAKPSCKLWLGTPFNRHQVSFVS